MVITDKFLVCATTPASGVRHRFMVLSKIKHFADAYGYSVCMLWGVTRGVSYCHFEELFAPVPGVRVANISAEHLAQVIHGVQETGNISFDGQSLPVFHPGEEPGRNLFSWDFAGGGALARIVPGREREVIAQPSVAVRARIAGFIRKHGLAGRLGIRVRVEECLHRPRKPHRIRRELDQVLWPITKISPAMPVFVVTDSEYIQQKIAAHFLDTKFLWKEFDLQEPTGRYVHRQDKDAMTTFLQEIECLCRCRKIINIGGFLNEGSVRDRIVKEPYAGERT